MAMMFTIHLFCGLHTQGGEGGVQGVRHTITEIAHGVGRYGACTAYRQLPYRCHSPGDMPRGPEKSGELLIHALL